MLQDERPDQADDPDDLRPPFLSRWRLVSAILVVIGITGIFPAMLLLLFLTEHPSPIPTVPSETPPVTGHVTSVVCGQVPDFIGPGGQAVIRQTVYIDAVMDEDAYALGSGFTVRPGIVVTAAHVGGEKPPTHVEVGCDGRKVSGHFLYRNHLRDVAVLEAPGCPAEPLQFDETPLVASDLVAISRFGFDTAMHTAYRTVILTPPDPDATLIIPPDDLRTYEGRSIDDLLKAGTKLVGTHVFLHHGNSGSPVFRPDGRIVGMAVIRDTRSNLGYAIAATHIIAALRETHVL